MMDRPVSEYPILKQTEVWTYMGDVSPEPVIICPGVVTLVVQRKVATAHKRLSDVVKTML
jgi:hypothetical protein